MPVLVTGVSPKGIGASTALALASQQPALLILASRTPSKVDEVARQILVQHPATRLEIVPLDLGSQQSVRAAAASVAQLTPHLDLLINNAGVVVTSRHATPEGIEQQFGTNHIGPFLLTNLLLPLLCAAARAPSAVPGATRVVSLSSAGHRLSPIRFSDYNFGPREVPPEEDHFRPLAGAFAKCTPDGYNGIVTYAQSKTANILFTLSLQQGLAGQGITAYSLHPGSIETELSRNQDEELNAQFSKVALYWKTVDEGCSTTVVAATDPALNGEFRLWIMRGWPLTLFPDIKGLYLVDCQFKDPAPHASDPVAAERLWGLSEELVGQTFDLTATA